MTPETNSQYFKNREVIMSYEPYHNLPEDEDEKEAEKGICTECGIMAPMVEIVRNFTVCDDCALYGKIRAIKKNIQDLSVNLNDSLVDIGDVLGTLKELRKEK